MAIDVNGMFVPESLESIKNSVQNNQSILGTKFEVFESTVYQTMCNPIITSLYNIQTLLAELPTFVNQGFAIENMYINRANVNTSDSITSIALLDGNIDYCEIFNITTTAGIWLYIYKDDFDYTNIDLQNTANTIALKTPVFVPYMLDLNTELQKQYVSTVSLASNISVIFNVAVPVIVDVNIITSPVNLGGLSEVLIQEFTNLFTKTQTIGKQLDIAFYQRNLWNDSLSKIDFVTTPEVDVVETYQILRVGIVRINGV
jgi:hypothetical protein